MEELRATLLERGVNTESMDDEQVRKIASAMNIPLPRKVEVVDYKGALYIKSSGIPVPHRDADKAKEGKTQNAKGAFVRVEAAQQMIEDLHLGLGLLNTTDADLDNEE